MRAGRLLRLVLLLQRRGRMSAPRLAEELGVSVRTVFRDIEALSGVGVPVYAVRGASGGFELLDGFDHEVPIPTSTDVAPATASRARVRLTPSARRLAALLGRPEGIYERPNLPVPDDRSGWIEVSMRFGSIDSGVLDLLALGPGVDVISPVALRNAVHRAASEIAATNRDEPAITAR